MCLIGMIMSFSSCSSSADWEEQQHGGCFGRRGDHWGYLCYSGGFYCFPHEKKLTNPYYPDVLLREDWCKGF